MGCKGWDVDIARHIGPKSTGLSPPPGGALGAMGTVHCAVKRGEGFRRHLQPWLTLPAER